MAYRTEVDHSAPSRVVCTPHTLEPLQELGLDTHQVTKLAMKLHAHSVQYAFKLAAPQASGCGWMMKERARPGEEGRLHHQGHLMTGTRSETQRGLGVGTGISKIGGTMMSGEGMAGTGGGIEGVIGEAGSERTGAGNGTGAESEGVCTHTPPSTTPPTLILPEIYRSRVACIYNTDKKCIGMTIPDHFDALYKVFHKAKALCLSALAYTEVSALHQQALHLI
eukprot:1160445-Pelagomonas_calceolata.AAC.6